ncbi:response regulator [Nitrincola tibetensis]|uniref:Transcriptional regulatory protein n=1 Tax=Nitrincola tibetensis TaxID=2219697 RepID=A0A364NK33_9GAMM|nr:response regulator [Nitrincola tibetensis]RAU17247.1 response regulator [Nitrincola tibetensis]
MTDRSYKVLIIEDDFRVAEINRHFIEQAPDFEVIKTCYLGKDALEFLKDHSDQVDLVLLDAYIPDVLGLELLWEMRKEYRLIDIVMITAAKEVETIQEALKGGVFDYLIKPIEQARMQQMLSRFRQERVLLKDKTELSQDELDRQLNRKIRPDATLDPQDKLPKGIDRLTLEKVFKALQESTQAQTATGLSSQTGVSRSTARRYLEYLVTDGKVVAELDYGEVGRPERRYRLL